jgi:DNA-directed RNA polymerase subunit E'/Rpb7
MYQNITKKLTVRIHPKDFYGDVISKVKQTVISKTINKWLFSEVDDYYYYTTEVSEYMDISAGILDIDSGEAVYNVSFDCLALIPKKGDIIIGKVETLNSSGIFCFTGSLEIFISSKMIPSMYSFESLSDKAEAFVADDTDFITIGSEIRVKIIGIRSEIGDTLKISCVGSMKNLD